jgi:hypothetical protein
MTLSLVLSVNLEVRVPAVYLKQAAQPFLSFLRNRKINKLRRMKGGG